jgi:tetratricopeptide (TPR) repeat protein
MMPCSGKARDLSKKSGGLVTALAFVVGGAALLFSIRTSSWADTQEVEKAAAAVGNDKGVKGGRPLTGFGASGAPSQKTQTSAELLMAQVGELEDKGDLQDALVLLGRPELAVTQSPHAEAVRGVLEAQEFADYYHQSHQYHRALSEFNKLVPRLDSVRDSHLIRAISVIRDRLEADLRASDEREARVLLDQAGVLQRSGKYKEAGAVYSQLLNRTSNDVAIDETLLLRAKQGVIETTGADIRAQNPSWLSSLENGLLTLLQWAIYVLMAYTLVNLLMWVPQVVSPRKGTVLDLVDLSAPDDQRDESSRNLMQQMFWAIKELIRNSEGSNPIDQVGDLDGTVLVNLRVLVPDRADKVGELIHDTSVLQIGPLAIGARQLYELLRPILLRPYQESLVGALTVKEGLTVLSVERVTRKWFPNRLKEWYQNRRHSAVVTKTSANGGHSTTVQTRSPSLATDQPDPVSCNRWVVSSASRAEVVNEVAKQIIFERTRGLGSTDSPQSFCFTHTALALLANDGGTTANREKLLQDARDALQEAVRFDPANFVAIFTLAAVMRKQGLNEESAQHLEMLGTMINDRNSKTVASYLEKHPEFPFIVYYSLASTLSKTDDWDDCTRAVAILTELLRRLSNCECPQSSNAAVNGVDRSLPEESDLTALLDELSALFDQKQAKPCVERPLNCPRQRARLKMLCLSALAAALVFDLEKPTEYLLSKLRRLPKDADKKRQRRKDILKIVDYICSYLNAMQSSSQAPLDWQAYILSLTVALNASGRANFFQGDYRVARAKFRRAVNLMPDFVDAKVNLAGLYICYKNRVHAAWVSKSERHLNQALQRMPSNQKALYLLAKLYASPSVGKYSEAEKLLRHALPDAWVDRLLAEICAEHITPRKLGEAIRLLRNSIVQFPRVDSRYLHFLEYMLQYVKEEKQKTGYTTDAQFARDLKFIERRITHRPEPHNSTVKAILGKMGNLQAELRAIKQDENSEETGLPKGDGTPCPGTALAPGSDGVTPGPSSTNFAREPEPSEKAL